MSKLFHARWGSSLNEIYAPLHLRSSRGERFVRVCRVPDGESFDDRTGRFQHFSETSRRHVVALHATGTTVPKVDFNPVINWIGDHCQNGWECYPDINEHEELVLLFSFEDRDEAALFRLTFG